MVLIDENTDQLSYRTSLIDKITLFYLCSKGKSRVEKQPTVLRERGKNPGHSPLPGFPLASYCVRRFYDFKRTGNFQESQGVNYAVKSLSRAAV